tara:strand:- start:25295 stop:25594 length:300 start_codon:yes stop_codon:yes gene_type:complete
MNSEMIKTNLYQVESLNDGLGWQWNKWFQLEEAIWFDPSVLSSARQLLRYCRDKLQILSEESKGKLTIEDDGYNVCVNLRNGETIFAFCYGENWKENGL